MRRTVPAVIELHLRRRDQFGYDLSAGDADGDRHADIAVGVPYETLRLRP
jgi:hypothetical protein